MPRTRRRRFSGQRTELGARIVEISPIHSPARGGANHECDRRVVRLHPPGQRSQPSRPVSGGITNPSATSQLARRTCRPMFRDSGRYRIRCGDTRSCSSMRTRRSRQADSRHRSRTGRSWVSSRCPCSGDAASAPATRGHAMWRRWARRGGSGGTTARCLRRRASRPSGR